MLLSRGAYYSPQCSMVWQVVKSSLIWKSAILTWNRKDKLSLGTWNLISLFKKGIFFKYSTSSLLSWCSGFSLWSFMNSSFGRQASTVMRSAVVLSPKPLIPQSASPHFQIASRSEVRPVQTSPSCLGWRWYMLLGCPSILISLSYPCSLHCWRIWHLLNTMKLFAYRNMVPTLYWKFSPSFLIHCLLLFFCVRCKSLLCL